MEYEISIKEIDDMLVASDRFIGTHEDTIKHSIDLYKKYWRHKQGTLFSLYYDKEYKNESDVECCIPVKGVKESETKIVFGGRAVSTKHVGKYETIGNAYMALFTFMRQNGLEMDTPTRLVFEKYPKDLKHGKEDDYVTEVIIPIK